MSYYGISCLYWQDVPKVPMGLVLTFWVCLALKKTKDACENGILK